MFWFREQYGRAELAFTDGSSDLAPPDRGLREIPAAFGVERVAIMRQVHGAAVALADPDAVPTADALLLDRPGVAAVVRVADCVPVVLADATAPLGAVVHAGRVGMAEGVIAAAVGALRDRGAQQVRAWIGPHACGSCYEVPEAMAHEVDALVPGTAATTSWGTHSLDLGAGVAAQLRALDVAHTAVGGCTIEDERFHSYRRQGAAAGRFGAVLALREAGDAA
ncbi:laccase domain-containing protein [Aeromicrobium phragmitis]|uniref:Laccase domain-containing protein n=1 Tax=Aeromicrobium phragmitis TaxID=2478914 RepID=A0A3L8PKK0_9ACTN|nr:polyphenol oxidase family protein [Aeromicrobium phragmitis]RLV55915.1 laccase domain-containing protein [Aeromicrobium phragmitis]